jgi:phage baseplate assembly protein W
MTYEIDTSQPLQINWIAKGKARIIQNVINLINTWRYEVAYARVQGIDPALLDKPGDVAADLYAAEVFRVVADHEPRAAVKQVNKISIDSDGNIQCKVVIEV